MTDAIEELDPGRAELAELREEAVALREERKKQAGLVAGLAHQRDLYRVLVSENDGEGERVERLTRADARAEGLPALEVRHDALGGDSGARGAARRARRGGGPAAGGGFRGGPRAGGAGGTAGAG